VGEKLAWGEQLGVYHSDFGCARLTVARVHATDVQMSFALTM
jgi:hypothetical protein